MGDAKRRKLAGNYPAPRTSIDPWAHYASLEGTMDLAHALEHVRLTKAGAYAFVPEHLGDRVIGGSVWLLAHDPEHEEGPEEFDEVGVHYFGGRFGSLEGEEDWFSLNEVEQQLRGLRFYGTMVEPHRLSFLDLPVILRLLEGGAEGEVTN